MSLAGILAASGYGGNSLVELFAKGPIDAGMLVEKNAESDLLVHITSGQVMGGLLECGNSIRFFKPVHTGPWRGLELNQEWVLDQPQTSSVCIQSCGRYYKAIKMDDDVRRAMCDNYEMFESSMLDNVWLNYSNLAHYKVLTGMQSVVSDCNRGTRAGRHRNINLGTYTTPRHLTAQNIVSFFTQTRGVLDDAGRWYEGGMFMLAPRQMFDLLLHTGFEKQMCCDFNDNILIKGLRAKDIHGFTMYETARLRSHTDPNTKRVVYPILFGWQDAYAYNGVIDTSGIDKIPRSNGFYYYWLSTLVHGGIYPDALALAYVTFDTEDLVV